MMLNLKKIVKLVVCGIFLSLSFLACSEDDKVKESSERIIEDLANLKDDPKFLEYIEESSKAAFRVKNSKRVLELLEIELLNDQQTLELAQVLGFDTIEQQEKYYKNLFDMEYDIEIRYDFINQNITEVNRLLSDAYLKILNTGFANASKKGVSQDKVLDDCLKSTCYPLYDAIIRPIVEMKDAECGFISFDMTETEKLREQLCRKRINQRFSAERLEASRVYECCAFDRCGIILPQIIGDGVTSECGTPVG